MARVQDVVARYGEHLGEAQRRLVNEPLGIDPRGRHLRYAASFVSLRRSSYRMACHTSSSLRS